MYIGFTQLKKLRSQTRVTKIASGTGEFFSIQVNIYPGRQKKGKGADRD